MYGGLRGEEKRCGGDKCERKGSKNGICEWGVVGVIEEGCIGDRGDREGCRGDRSDVSEERKYSGLRENCRE